MTAVTPIARPLRVLWVVVCVTGALAMAVLGALAVTQSPSAMPEKAETAFYAVALLSLVAIMAAFALVRDMERRLARQTTEAETARTIRSYGLAALAVAEVPALAGGAAAFLTGDLLSLAFGAPLFAFAWLTWPTDDRVAAWLRHREPPRRRDQPSRRSSSRQGGSSHRSPSRRRSSRPRR